LFDAAAVPETLKALLRFIAADYVAEVEAFTAGANAWLAGRGDHPLVLEPPTARAIGMAPCLWRGHAIEVGILPYRIWLLQKVQDAGQAAPGLLEETGLGRLLAARVGRRVERVGYLERWVT